MNIWDKRRIAESMVDTLKRLGLHPEFTPLHIGDSTEHDKISKFTFREMFGNA